MNTMNSSGIYTGTLLGYGSIVKEVQTQAQNAIDEVVKSAQVTRSKTLYLSKKYRYASLDHLINDMMEVDASRTLSDEAREAMTEAYEVTMQHDKDGDYIDHWYKLDVLEVGG